jgi:hypothetical protein
MGAAYRWGQTNSRYTRWESKSSTRNEHDLYLTDIHNIADVDMSLSALAVMEPSKIFWPRASNGGPGKRLSSHYSNKTQPRRE